MSTALAAQPGAISRETVERIVREIVLARAGGASPAAASGAARAKKGPSELVVNISARHVHLTGDTLQLQPPLYIRAHREPATAPAELRVLTGWSNAIDRGALHAPGGAAQLVLGQRARLNTSHVPHDTAEQHQSSTVGEYRRPVAIGRPARDVNVVEARRGQCSPGASWPD